MAGRIGGPKTRNGGLWTEARFRSFVKGNLRAATMRWNPIAQCLKNARVARGEYLCNGCKQIVPNTIRVEGKRKKNVHVDHIIPIIDPATGWTSYDDMIDRMFCEIENLQVLCDECHTKKTNEEKAIAKERRQRDKQEEEDLDE